MQQETRRCKLLTARNREQMAGKKAGRAQFQYSLLWKEMDHVAGRFVLSKAACHYKSGPDFTNTVRDIAHGLQVSRDRS